MHSSRVNGQQDFGQPLCALAVLHGAQHFPKIYFVQLTNPHQTSQRVQHRPKVVVSDEMFVAHRTSINTDIDVYPFVKEDLSEMEELLQQRPRISLIGPSMESLSVSSDSFDESTKHLIDIIKEIAVDVLYNEKSEFDLFIIRAGSVGRENSTAVGFVILR